MCLTQCLHAEAPFFTHNRRITGNPTGLFLFSYLNGWLNVMVHGISRYILRLFLLGSRVVRYQLLPQITCMYVCTILYFAKHTHVYIIYIVYMCVLCKILFFDYLIHIFFMYILILMLISISSISGDTNIIWHHFAWFSVGCSPLGGCHVVPSRSAVEQCAEPTRRCLRRWKHLTVSWAAR